MGLDQTYGQTDNLESNAYAQHKKQQGSKSSNLKQWNTLMANSFLLVCKLNQHIIYSIKMLLLLYPPPPNSLNGTIYEI